MNLSNKKILYIDLEKREFEISSQPELHKYVGGIGLGLGLLSEMSESSAFVFSVGPLNGFFPFVSKTCLISFSVELGVSVAYLGGSLSARIKYSGYDAVVLFGKSDHPVYLAIGPEGVKFCDSTNAFEISSSPGKSSRIVADSDTYMLDGYFTTASAFLEQNLVPRSINGMSFNVGPSVKINDVSRYGTLFKEILSRGEKLKVLPSENPSCVGCSLGCSSSQVGESTGQYLTHCLVACDFASDIYSDLGIVFSCLNTLGYDYTHEDLEGVPGMVERLFSSLEERSAQDKS